MQTKTIAQRWALLGDFVNAHAQELAIAMQMDDGEAEAFRKAYGLARQQMDEPAIAAAETALAALQASWA